MCIGDKDALGESVEFADNIIAVINEKKLLAIYLNLKSIDLKGVSL